MTGDIAPRTVIEAWLPMAGAVGLDLVLDSANAAGLEDRPVRLALRRMVAAGEVVQTGRGRRGSVALTEAGRSRLARDRAGLVLAQAQDEGRAPWDGVWRLTAVSLPEAERARRDLLRRRLTELGAAPVSTGLYLSPHPLEGLLDAAGEALVRAEAARVDVRGTTDPREVVELLWPAAPVVDGYRALEEVVGRVAEVAHRVAAEQVTTLQLRVADAVEEAMRHDPLIPPELRPAPWPPARIREEWRSVWRTLASRAPGGGVYQGWPGFRAGDARDPDR
ncbi:PaaX family transcriptional regulator C-terminal domain-containing protein [Nocardiopsis sp. CC223A]|uniref:PaaX family transcriptional regulator C-terminal domain-containing protein n=1 Tax=Nocardiopsis sp. CC223A TaxID=3044051 RepID=UPI0027963879|nr:PaaX family transcriptional regulator C-terminal domain-containing protein [Nocardiopsis sp. CC223A]